MDLEKAKDGIEFFTAFEDAKAKTKEFVECADSKNILQLLYLISASIKSLGGLLFVLTKQGIKASSN